MASYPTSAKAFTTKVDGPGNTILAAHINDLQAEVTAVETDLIAGLPVARGGTGNTTLTANRVLLGNGASAVAVTAAATAGQALLATAGAPAFGDVAGAQRCVAYNNTTQSVNDSTPTVLALNAEDLDVGSMHDTSSNNSRITIPTGADGFYVVMGQATPAADADGYRQLEIYKNGSTILGTSIAVGTSTSFTTIPVVWAGALVATDYVELRFTHTAGAALNIGSATRGYANALTAIRIV